MSKHQPGRRSRPRQTKSYDSDTETFTPQEEGKRISKEDTAAFDWKEKTEGKRHDTEYSLYDELSPEENLAASKRNDVVECAHCGEEYSTTYRRCPFCDERSVGPAFAKRHTKNNFMDPRHLVGVCITMGIIFSAGAIVFQQMKPLLGVQTANPDSTTGSSSENASTSVTPPVVTEPDVPTTPDVTEPDVPTTPDVTVPDVPTTPDVTVPDVPTEPVAPTTPDTTTPATTTLKLNYTDVTLKAEEGLALSVSGATSGSTITWTSSHPEIATVDANGNVKNVYIGSGTKVMEITATINGTAIKCVLRCQGLTSADSATDTGTTTPSTGNITAGDAVITGASSGLRVRAGAGTSYDISATLLNGNPIVVVASAGDGWYQISYIGDGGVKQIGYILGEYIEMS